MKYVFVTGGVTSSLGKGITAASVASILESRGIPVTITKLDPYINVDPGTLSPTQHGEVFVTHDGTETDLDLGHYERFTNIKTTHRNNYTAGQIYESVINKERKGEYLGQTVQVVPHITDEIIRCIEAGAIGAKVALVEVGGTIGDIESLPFIEAIRQLILRVGVSNACLLHLTYLPYLKAAGEIKTKPTQHSVTELRALGLQPDILICRSEEEISLEIKQKIELFTNVPCSRVISCPDVSQIYKLPRLLHEQDVDKSICNILEISAPQANLADWDMVVREAKIRKSTINIAIVGKYSGWSESYKSLIEALKHAGIHTNAGVNIVFIESGKWSERNKELVLDAIVVPGGFGPRDIEGKIDAIKYARVNDIPFLGICLGMQLAVIEYSRNVVGLKDANSTEFDTDTKCPVVALVHEWTDMFGNIEKRYADTELGGTMRLGAQECHFKAGSLAARGYGGLKTVERHRHRYEINNALLPEIESAGLVVSGRSGDKNNLCETIELSDHKWFFGCQYHPEYTSNPRQGHPLFISFVNAAKTTFPLRVEEMT